MFKLLHCLLLENVKIGLAVIKVRRYMTQINDVYKCEICGNIIESIHSGSDSLTCCGQLMTKVELKSGPDGQEKHLPVVEKNDNKIIVKIGSISHPMTEEHYMEGMEIIIGDEIQRVFLKPGDEPIAEFEVANTDASVVARAYCNIHGLWVTNL